LRGDVPVARAVGIPLAELVAEKKKGRG